jgi:hypothetical protein
LATKTTTGRGAALWALFALLAAIYLVTGSGRFHIVDEVSLFAVTESVAKRGAFDTNAIAWTQWVNSPGEVLGAFGPEGDDFSKKGPAPAFLAMPFYLIGWLSTRLPVAALHLSMLQTAFWLNAVITALTGVLLARAALALGYSLRTAVLAGAIFGLSTIAWPYATHFFGEPVSALAIFGLFYALLRLRQTGAPRYALLGGVAAGVMITTSAAHAVLLAPFGVYLLFAVHQWARRRAQASNHKVRGAIRYLLSAIGQLLAFVVPLAALAGLLVIYNLARFGTPFSTGYHFESGEGFNADWLLGLWGLLFSPYRGLFWYTPLAILSVFAWPGFIRRHRAEGWLTAIVALILVLMFGKWWMWWGGFAWGPRFLVPLAPFLVLVLAPWLEVSQVPGARRMWPTVRRAVVIIMIALSFIVQLLAVTANYVNYEIALRSLYPTDWADPLKYGPPALFNPAHSPVLGQVRLLAESLAANLDLGWIWEGQVAWQVPALAGGIALVAGLTWLLMSRRSTRRLAPAAAALAVAGLLALGVISARVYAMRPEYGAAAQGYAAALAEIDAAEAQQPGRGDAIVTVAPYHYQVPMARYRGRLPIYGYATESTPLHPETESVLWRALARHERLWLVTVGLSPADPNNGIEAWLAREAFKADDRWLDDARLAQFVTAPRLEPLDVRARLGENVRLQGARLSSETVHPGDTLAVELNWVADGAPGDLRGFVQLLAADGRLMAQQDGIPGGGYAPSTGWQPGITVADRRGLVLPADLAPGDYTLIAGLYDAATGPRLPVTGPDGATAGNFVRLGTIRVE